MSLEVTTGASGPFKSGTPKALFAGPFSDPARAHLYDVTPDGERFLVVRRVGEDSSDPVVVDIYWSARLSRR